MLRTSTRSYYRGSHDPSVVNASVTALHVVLGVTHHIKHSQSQPLYLKKAIEYRAAGLEDALAVLELPKRYRQRLRTSNMQERLVREIRRRGRVIYIFPNEASALRIIGAVLA